MSSPFIETYGITESEFDNLQTTMTLHPEIQEAIDTRTSANVDGDYYNRTLAALVSLGYTKGERLTFKKPASQPTSAPPGNTVLGRLKMPPAAMARAP